MRRDCFYYDELDQNYHKTNLWEMKALEIDNHTEYLRRKANLYGLKNKKTRMQLVAKGAHQGFRRFPQTSRQNTYSARGDNESLSHQGNKEAIASLREIKLISGNEIIIVHVKKIELEKRVTCNNRNYEIDIFVEIERTEPEKYKDLWNEQLWIEVFHTCKVDKQQADDFAIEGLPLFETKIPDKYTFYEHITKEGYEKRKSFLTERYKQFGVVGLLFPYNDLVRTIKWRLSREKNPTMEWDNYRFTIIEDKKGDGFGIVYANKTTNKPKTLWKYNNKRFKTIEDAKKFAEYAAFRLYNNDEISPKTIDNQQ